MSFTWTPEEYEALPASFKKARRLLEEWFQSMQDGTVEQRLPDPQCPVTVSQEQAARIMELMDVEFDKELAWAKSPEAGSYTAGPGFHRLKPAQKLALAQQLYAILAVYKDNAKTPAEASATSNGWYY